jgi:hypothetical protein
MTNQKLRFTTILLTLGCFAFLPQTRAITPAPDGCYPNYTTAEGCNALHLLTGGFGNTGIGWYALFGTSSGNFNTAVGGGALVLNNGDSNTATGAAALLLNTVGTQNTAVGTDAMVYNDSGNNNTAVGAFALTNNTTGTRNIAVGSYALTSHVGPPMDRPAGASGEFNNAVGSSALTSDVNGAFNNAFGGSALGLNVSGVNNTAVGDMALANSTGDYNTALGAGSGTDPGIVSNNIYIGDPGFPGDENVISIGGIAASGTDYTATFIGGIYGADVTTGTALPVYVDTDGHLGTNLVTASGRKIRLPNARGAQHQVEVNEFQRQQKRIAELENTVARLAATVKEQAAQIEKVSAQLELRKPAPRVVLNKE